MSLIEVKVPQLSESVAEATLLQWRKKPGQAVELDEILVEIETDKVVLEVPAPAAGVLAQIIKNDGDSCIADEVIAKIDTEGQEAVSGAMQIKSVPPAEPAPGETPSVQPEVAARAETTSEVAMPAAAKLMAEHDIPVGAVQGTGKGGRVTKGDVLEVLSAPPAGSTPAARPATPAAAFAVRRVRGGELAPQSMQLTLFVVRLAHRRCRRRSEEPLLGLSRLLERSRPIAVEAHQRTAIDEASSAERETVGLAGAPVIKGMRPVLRPAEIEQVVERLDRAAVDDPGRERREFAGGHGDHRVIEERDPFGDLA